MCVCVCKGMNEHACVANRKTIADLAQHNKDAVLNIYGWVQVGYLLAQVKRVYLYNIFGQEVVQMHVP